MWRRSTAPSAGHPCGLSESDPPLFSTSCHGREQKSGVTCQIDQRWVLCRFYFGHTPVLFLCVSQEFLQFLYSLSCQPSNDHVFDGFNHFSLLTALTSGAQSGTCNAMCRQLINAANDLKSLQLFGVCFWILTLVLLWPQATQSIERHSAKKKIRGRVCLQNKTFIYF